jgi:hypothetical protein
MHESARRGEAEHHKQRVVLRKSHQRLCTAGTQARRIQLHSLRPSEREDLSHGNKPLIEKSPENTRSPNRLYWRENQRGGGIECNRPLRRIRSRPGEDIARTMHCSSRVFRGLGKT